MRSGRFTLKELIEKPPSVIAKRVGLDDKHIAKLIKIEKEYGLEVAHAWSLSRVGRRGRISPFLSTTTSELKALEFAEQSARFSESGEGWILEAQVPKAITLDVKQMLEDANLFGIGFTESEIGALGGLEGWITKKTLLK